MRKVIEKLFPSSQGRGGAKRRGGQFGRLFRRSSIEASPYRARASRHPVCAFGTATPPLRGGECVRLIILALLAVGLLGSAAAQNLPYDLVLRNGRFGIDSGSRWHRGDVAIRGDTIVLILLLHTDNPMRMVHLPFRMIALGFI